MPACGRVIHTSVSRYWLATYEILDGEHEHNGAVIIEAETLEKAEEVALDQEYSPETVYTDEEKDDGRFKYFDFGGDGTTAARNQGIVQIAREEMQFLERIGLAYRL